MEVTQVSSNPKTDYYTSRRYETNISFIDGFLIGVITVFDHKVRQSGNFKTSYSSDEIGHILALIMAAQILIEDADNSGQTHRMKHYTAQRVIDLLDRARRELESEDTDASSIPF